MPRAWTRSIITPRNIADATSAPAMSIGSTDEAVTATGARADLKGPGTSNTVFASLTDQTTSRSGDR